MHCLEALWLNLTFQLTILHLIAKYTIWQIIPYCYCEGQFKDERVEYFYNILQASVPPATGAVGGWWSLSHRIVAALLTVGYYLRPRWGPGKYASRAGMFDSSYYSGSYNRN